jgi:hypothetical protein
LDQLGLEVLKDMEALSTWNVRNYVLEAQQLHGLERGEPTEAVAEAIGWLLARGLIATDPENSSNGGIFVTRTGKRVAAEGPEVFYATERLQRGVLHPLIEEEGRPQFLIGKYEQGVFAAMRAVEVRVRKLAKLSDADYGVPLMNTRFGQAPSAKVRGRGNSRELEDLITP